MSTFQIVLLVIFGVLIVAAVLVFAGFGGFGGTPATPELTMWGTMSADSINGLLGELDKIQQGILKIKYVEKDPSTFDVDFTEALAEGNGPDIIILPQDEIMEERNKLYVIPFGTLSDRTVKDTFISEASLFYTSNGYLAEPFTIDPLVMYWNRDLFQSAGLVSPPTYWDEFASLTKSLTVKDQASNVLKSTIAFGEFQNVNSAKEIISTLIFQAGNPITILALADPKNTNSADRLQSVIDQNPINAPILPAESALDFYTQFADPSKSVFSWNRSLPLSTNAFLSGELATYFGFASEYLSLKDKNPNLNFDVAPLPQPRNTSSKVTFGRMNGLAIVKSSSNIAAAYNSINILTSSTAVGILSGFTNLPPVRRDLLANTSGADASHVTFKNAALISQAWLDPNPQSTNQIFSDMVESILSGNQKTSDAISIGNTEISNLIK